MRFRQRLPEVEAIQYDGTRANETAIFDLAGTPTDSQERGRTIKATFGKVEIGDWFVKTTGFGVQIVSDAAFKAEWEEIIQPVSPVKPQTPDGGKKL